MEIGEMFHVERFRFFGKSLISSQIYKAANRVLFSIVCEISGKTPRRALITTFRLGV
jgi:hypothetical protein